MGRREPCAQADHFVKRARTFFLLFFPRGSFSSTCPSSEKVKELWLTLPTPPQCRRTFSTPLLFRGDGVSRQPTVVLTGRREPSSFLQILVTKAALAVFAGLVYIQRLQGHSSYQVIEIGVVCANFTS